MSLLLQTPGNTAGIQGVVIPHIFPYLSIRLHRWTGSNRKSPKVFRNFIMQINTNKSLGWWGTPEIPVSKVHRKAGNAGKSGRAREEQFPMELKHISTLTPPTFQITSEEKIRGDEKENQSLAGEKGKNWVAHSSRTEKPKDTHPGREGAPLQHWVQPQCTRTGVTSGIAERIKWRVKQEFKLQPNNPVTELLIQEKFVKNYPLSR